MSSNPSLTNAKMSGNLLEICVVRELMFMFLMDTCIPEIFLYYKSSILFYLNVSRSRSKIVYQGESRRLFRAAMLYIDYYEDI